jgi:hypothetical protein
MKTMLAFTMALATLVLVTAADAQDRQCQMGRNGIGVRAGTPCVIGPLRRFHPTEIIKPPHNGTAVLRADGSIYYSPKPGFTGRDGIGWVRGASVRVVVASGLYATGALLFSLNNVF